MERNLMVKRNKAYRLSAEAGRSDFAQFTEQNCIEIGDR
jgi:hypothetical protein